MTFFHSYFLCKSNSLLTFRLTILLAVRMVAQTGGAHILFHSALALQFQARLSGGKVDTCTRPKPTRRPTYGSIRVMKVLYVCCMLAHHRAI